MIVPGSAHALLLSTSGYTIPYSLRFRAANSAYMSRSFGTPTSNIKWTWSGWIKRGALGTQLVFNGGDGSSNNFFSVQFTAGDLIQIAQISGGAYNLQMTTSAVFRDPSAWYHIVIVYDSANATSTDRVQIYINNSRQNVSYTTGPFGSSTACQWNVNARTHYLRRLDYSAIYGDMYSAEENFIDGQALTPSSFGQTDATTGVWVPKKYSGTYGNNGFYLKFADASAATAAAIGKDSSGNGNNWTPSGISVTSGVTFDQMLDTPTLNYCTGNPLSRHTTNTYNFTNGNLEVEMFDSSNVQIQTRMSMGVSSGKWYWEATLVSYSIYQPSLGVAADNILNGNYVGGTALQWGVYGPNGDKYNNGVFTAYGSAATTNDVVQIALDMDNGKIWWGKNGTWFASGNPASGTNAAFTNLAGNTVLPAMGVGGTTNAGGKYAFNFGQRAFAYTPPTGFKALNTANLPTPSIKKGSLYMDATLRTGTGATASVSSLGFQPDLVWIKSRSAATDHGLYDSARGVQKQLESNQAAAETTETTGLTAFSSNGYTVGALAQLNTNTATYVDWAWKEGTTPGFDSFVFSGNATNRTVSHGLGAVPHFMIFKNRNTANGWIVYHRNQNASPATGFLQLQSTAAFISDSTVFNNTAPTSSVFSLGTDISANGSGTNNIIAYLWTSIDGFSLFGSYTGNGSTDGPFVWCGFRPRYVLIKSTGTENWSVQDSARNPYNVVDARLKPNSADAEAVSSFQYVDFLSNGFKLRNTDTEKNGSGTTYVFAAFAENPFKYARAR